MDGRDGRENINFDFVTCPTPPTASAIQWRRHETAQYPAIICVTQLLGDSVHLFNN